MTTFDFKPWLGRIRQTMREDVVGEASRHTSSRCCSVWYEPEDLVQHIRSAHDGDVEPYVFAVRVAAKEWAQRRWAFDFWAETKIETATMMTPSQIVAVSEEAINPSLESHGAAS